jgi:hypothetical protein
MECGVWLITLCTMVGVYQRYGGHSATSRFTYTLKKEAIISSKR